MAELVITEKNFETEVLRAEKPVLLYFWGSWAGPCKKMSPIISEVAEAVGDKAIVGTVNVDEQRDIAAQFHAFRLPMISLFYKGERVDSLIGVRDKDYIVDWMGF